MEHREIPIGSIKPDPNQPRKSFDAEKIDGIAQSIKSEGIINAIEVDKDGVIITGECRWRAAKKAGLKTVPVKVISKISKEERFRRQLIENLHVSTLTTIESAKAIAKILNWRPGMTIPFNETNKLSAIIGMSSTNIRLQLEILNLDPEIQGAIRRKKLAVSVVPALKLVPEKFRKKLLKKIENEKISRDSAIAISKSIHFNQDLGGKILSIDFEGKSTQEIYKILDDMAPTPSVVLQRDSDIGSEFNYLARKMNDWFFKYNFGDINPIQRAIIKLNFNILSINAGKWIRRQKLIARELKELPPGDKTIVEGKVK